VDKRQNLNTFFSPHYLKLGMGEIYKDDKINNPYWEKYNSQFLIN